MNHINRGLTFTGFKVISVFGGETRCLLCLRAPPLDVFPESLMNHAHFPSCTVNKVLSPTPRSFWMLVCASLCHTQNSGAPYGAKASNPQLRFSLPPMMFRRFMEHSDCILSGMRTHGIHRSKASLLLVSPWLEKGGQRVRGQPQRSCWPEESTRGGGGGHDGGG